MRADGGVLVDVAERGLDSVQRAGGELRALQGRLPIVGRGRVGRDAQVQHLAGERGLRRAAAGLGDAEAIGNRPAVAGGTLPVADRQDGVWGRGVSVGVDTGGTRLNKKKKK